MGTVQRDSITITILSYVGIVIGYVNKILLLPNFFSETQVGLVNILVSFSVIYAQFSALGINFTIVKFSRSSGQRIGHTTDCFSGRA